jgi:hypothetical protein
LLIEETNLLALDKVFDDFLEEKKNEEDAAKSVSREKRSVTIYLAAGRTVKSDRFADAIKKPDVNTEEPLGFRAHLEIGRVKASVSLTKLARNLVQPLSETQFQVQQVSPKLEFNVEPSDHQSAPELFSALQNWAADFAPSATRRAWARYRPAFGVIFLFWLLMGGILPLLPHLQASRDDDVDYRAEARQILREGVNEKNQRRAIEIILGIAAYNPPDAAHSFNWTPGKTYWPRYILGAIILLMLCCCPSVVIGLWKGKQNLQRWRLWMRWVIVIAPGTLFVTVLWPRILALVGL